MLGAFTALEISENTTGQDSESTRKNRAAHAPPPVERLNAPGNDNVYRLTSSLLVGSRPRDGSGLEVLAQLGVKTIINVDPAPFDASAAGVLGIRVVHLPLKYAGIDAAESARLIKAARTLPTPIYIQYRDSQDRAATAAALMAMGTEGWSLDDGLLWLKAVGTPRNHPRLYNSLKMFQIPSNAELTVVPDDWPESAEIPAITQSMLEIDQHWRELRASPNPSSARDLLECYRRVLHSPPPGDEFHKRLLQAIDNVQDLVCRLEQGSTLRGETNPDLLMGRSGGDCKGCHEAHRN